MVAIRTLCRSGDTISTSNKPNTTQLGLVGACEIAVELIRLHGPTDFEVAIQGLSALRNLTIILTNNTRIGANNGCEVVVSMLNIHGYNQINVAEQGLRAIVNLAIEENNRIILGNCGACHIVLEMLRLYGSSYERVVEQGLGAICNLAVVDANRSLLGHDGACSLVIDMLKLHVNALYSNNEIAKQACLAIVNLSHRNSNNIKEFHNLDTKATLKLLVVESISVTNEVAKKHAVDAIAKLDSFSMRSLFNF